MGHRLKLLIIALLYLKQAGQVLTVNKVVYQKDISDHCRRHMLPSIFLGRHVSEAHSHILHFSKMELPYSCFISVRGEPGNNIIVVIQMSSAESKLRACTENPNQLLVYEMGEMFGRFWGPMPEAIMNPPKSFMETPNVYTLRTMQTAKATVGLTPIVDNMSNNTETDQHVTIEMPETSETESDFIRIELPIVNVSAGLLVDSNDKPSRTFHTKKDFDILYDVSSRSRAQYDKSMIPLVQLPIKEELNSRRSDSQHRYQLEYNSGMFTPDVRLRIPYFSIRTITKKRTSRRKNRNKFLNFMKNKTTRRSLYGRQTYFTNFFRTSTDIFDYNNISKPVHIDIKSQLKDKIASMTTVKNWEQIEDMLKKLRDSIKNDDITKEMERNKIKNLPALSNINYNNSVHVHPNMELLHYITDYQVLTTKQNPISLTRKLLPQIILPIIQFQQSAFPSTLNLISDSPLTSKKTFKLTNSSDIITNTDKYIEMKTTEISDQNPTLVISKSASNPKEYKTEANCTTPHGLSADNFNKLPEITTAKYKEAVFRPLLTGSMVGRESWENVVQAAPVMAELLNQSVPHSNITMNTTVQETATRIVIRRKRNLKPISIDLARPRNLTTSDITTSIQPLEESDMQDFVHLVEQQTDELHDRVALTHLSKYFGNTLFNICEYHESRSQHVFVFNSSRIAIAVSNFTLGRLTLILTPASILLSRNAKCSLTSLECEVFGTRVCVDNSNACDGVPNCGSYNAYDEDRLICGGPVGLLHNVYLVAITFIAVLLTILCIVHYWLKRCIPKVSEAFFVYNDGAENILFLETIMRSPFDVDVSSNAYHGNLYENNDDGNLDTTRKSSRNVFCRAWKVFCNLIICRIKRKRYPSSLQIDISEELNKTKKTYSFTQFELNKMLYNDGKDVSVQTGNSLEISDTDETQKSVIQRKQYVQSMAHHDIAVSTEDTVQKYLDELNVLKILKVSKSDSLQSNNYEAKFVSEGERHSIEEEEIKIHLYDLHDEKRRKRNEKSSKHISHIASYEAQKPESSKRLSKHLRFEEELLTMPNNNDGADNVETLAVAKDKNWKRWYSNEDKVDNNEATVGSSKDFKRFWQKGKKSKRKTLNISLH